MCKIQHNLVNVVNIFVVCCIISRNIVCGQDFIFEHGPISHEQEGSVCEFRNNATSGICMQLKNCAAASSDFIKFQIIPTICSLGNDAPIVCCAVKNKFDAVERECRPKVTLEKRRSYIDGCLHVDLANRIVAGGGRLTSVGEFAHMVGIGWRDNHAIRWKCGGSLISSQCVLTAAHCTTSSGGAPDVVHIGETDLNNLSKENTYEISEIITHPEYVADQLYHDIAIIKLKGTVEFTNTIFPACLWQTKEIDFDLVTATGFGAQSFGGPTTLQLMAVNLNIVPVGSCNQAFGPSASLAKGINDATQICAGDRTGQMDTCEGDSGGPLQIYVDVLYDGIKYPKHLIVGVTSFGKACLTPRPGIYTRVSAYLDWIENIVWPQPFKYV